MLVSVFEGFSDEAKAAIFAAHSAARRLGARDTGSEHLLLGIVTTDSPTAAVLAELGLTAANVEGVIIERPGPPAADQHLDRWTPACLPVFATCLANRLALGDALIGVGYLAVAIADERYGEAAPILADLLGTSIPDVRATFLSHLGYPSWNEPDPTRPPSRPDGFKAGGLADPKEVALQGFAPEAHAYIAETRYKEPDHAVVKVGFPEQNAFYFLHIFRHDDGWRTEIPKGRRI